MDKKVSFRRLRFSVPNADVSVIEWIDAQANLSASIRELIKDSIRRNGIMDATCMRVEQRGAVGRPRKEMGQSVLEPVASVNTADISAATIQVPVTPQPAVHSVMVSEPVAFASVPEVAANMGVATQNNAVQVNEVQPNEQDTMAMLGMPDMSAMMSRR